MALSAAVIAMTTMAAGASAQTDQSSELSKSIALVCPSESGGTLEHSEVDRSGLSYRQQLTFANGQPAILVLAEARLGRPFRAHATIDLRGESDAADLVFAQIVVRRLSALLESVCLGAPEKRTQFLEQIRVNRASLGLP